MRIANRLIVLITVVAIVLSASGCGSDGGAPGEKYVFAGEPCESASGYPIEL
jgi:hypothetical protein